MFFPITYRFILPNFALLAKGQAYQAVPTDPDGDMITEAPLASEPRKSGKTSVYLTTSEKLALIRPLILRYMLPLCAVYIEEYVINSVSSVTGAAKVLQADRPGRRAYLGVSLADPRAVVSFVQVAPRLLPFLVSHLYAITPCYQALH